MDTIKQKLTKATPTFCQRLLACGLMPAEQLVAALAAIENNHDALPDYLVRKGHLTAFQVRQLRAGATSFHVEKYVVLDCLGRGSNGIVFKARTVLPPHRVVALKTLDARNLHGTDEALARFRREIDILTRLHHPNIVRAYEVIRTRMTLYLVMEYVEGEDLSLVLRKRGPLPVADAVDYTVQAARGLAYAHRTGIIHRDLKPANLLVTLDGKVKLSDLGMAREEVGGADAGLTMKGSSLGTPEFMAPEQAEDATKSTPLSDLYSLGATLFFCLTGELPVSGKSFVHVLQKLLTQPPRSVGELRPDLPAELVAVVDRLRARNPAERPQSADEVIALLEPFATRSECAPRDWDSQRKAALVVELLQGKLTATEACAKYGVLAAEVEAWQQRFLEAGQRGLDPMAAKLIDSKDEVKALEERLAEQLREIERLKQELAMAARPVNGADGTGSPTHVFLPHRVERVADATVQPGHGPESPAG